MALVLALIAGVGVSAAYMKERRSKDVATVVSAAITKDGKVQLQRGVRKPVQTGSLVQDPASKELFSHWQPLHPDTQAPTTQLSRLNPYVWTPAIAEKEQNKDYFRSFVKFPTLDADNPMTYQQPYISMVIGNGLALGANNDDTKTGPIKWDPPRSIYFQPLPSDRDGR